MIKYDGNWLVTKNSIDKIMNWKVWIEMITWEEAEYGGDGAEWDVVAAERDAEHGNAADRNANVGDEERVDEGEVRQPSDQQPSHSVDDADDRDQERSVRFANALFNQCSSLSASFCYVNSFGSSNSSIGSSSGSSSVIIVSLEVIVVIVVLLVVVV